MNVFKFLGQGFFVDAITSEIIIKRIVVINNFVRLHEVFPCSLVYRLRGKKANHVRKGHQAQNSWRPTKI